MWKHVLCPRSSLSYFISSSWTGLLILFPFFGLFFFFASDSGERGELKVIPKLNEVLVLREMMVRKTGRGLGAGIVWEGRVRGEGDKFCYRLAFHMRIQQL